MPTQGKLDDVIEALDTAGEDHSHYLDKRTGEIVLITNEEMDAAEEDELISEYPEWQRESILKAREILKSEDFVALPDQFDIHEYEIMEGFCSRFRIAASERPCPGLSKAAVPSNGSSTQSIRWAWKEIGLSFAGPRSRSWRFNGWSRRVSLMRTERS